jgi:transposase
MLERFKARGLVKASQRDHAVSLEGPVRAMPTRSTEAEQAYEQRHFAIDWENEKVTCPQGKTSVTWRAGRDDTGAARFRAVFSRTECGTCQARSLCTSSKEGRRAVYFLPRPEYEALNAAQDRMQDPAWKERSRRACAPSGCAGAATSAKPEPVCSRCVWPQR